MRWEDDPLKKFVGKRRVLFKFIWWPKKLKGEWRWLEKAGIIQEVKPTRFSNQGPLTLPWGKIKGYDHKWVDIGWFGT
jgi:hypothetical protein